MFMEKGAWKRETAVEPIRGESNNVFVLSFTAAAACCRFERLTEKQKVFAKSKGKNDSSKNDDDSDGILLAAVISVVVNSFTYGQASFGIWGEKIFGLDQDVSR